MSERLSLPRSVRASLASLTMAALLLSGCTAHHNTKKTPQSDQEQPTPTTNESFSYIQDAGRNARIAAAVIGFGQKVLSASKSINTSWGVFDTYCHPDSNVSGQGGWTSEGYKPKPGDLCSDQSNPLYQKSQRLKKAQLNATVVVGPNGSYTDNFRDVFENAGDCHDVMASVNPADNVWVTSYVDENGSQLNSLTAATPAAVDDIDRHVISCLDSATYNYK